MYELGVVYRNIVRTDREVTDSLASLGSATVHEAMGRVGLLKPCMRPIYSGAQVSGTAVTVLLHPEAGRPRDDHTLLWGPASSFVGHPYTLDKIPYDTRELLPVARVSNTVVSLAVPVSLNVGSLKEFMAMARERPGKFNWSSVTTVTDIVMEGFFKNAGMDVAKVSYKDGVAALNDIVEGRIQLYSSAYAIVRSQAQASNPSSPSERYLTNTPSDP